MNNKTIICGVYTFPGLTISVSLLIKNYSKKGVCCEEST